MDDDEGVVDVTDTLTETGARVGGGEAALITDNNNKWGTSPFANAHLRHSLSGW